MPGFQPAGRYADLYQTLKREFGAAAARISAVWIFLAMTELALLALLGNTVLSITSISRPDRILLVANEMLALALVTGILGGPLAMIRQLASGGKGIGRTTARLLVFSTAGTGLCLFIASWIQFRSTGRFLDWGGLTFFLTNPVQLVQHFGHMEPYLTAAAPFAFLIFGLLPFAIDSFVGRLPGSVQRRIAAYSIAIVISLAVVVAGGDVRQEDHGGVVDPGAGTVFTMEDLYTECRLNRSGAAIHALADLAGSFGATEDEPAADPGIGVEMRPIITMQDYLTPVARSRLKPWNVIVVVIESLRIDQLRAGGSPVEVLPNLEALARGGRAYVGTYTQASHSNYADLCILSSHYPLRSPRTHVYPKQPTYPRVLIYDVLKALGYRTAIISSQDENWGAMINYLDTGNVDHFVHAANFAGPTYVPYGDWGVTAWIKGSRRSGKIDDRYTISEAVRWTGLPEAEPFCLYINLQKSHVPYETPLDFPRRFGIEKLPFSIGFNQFPPEQAPLVKLAYANSLAYVDFHLGRLLDSLKKRGQWDRTVIVVTGDNGQAFFEHGFAAHANQLFDEVMKVPVVLRAPGLPASVDGRLAEHVDIPPTLLELLGMPPHPGFQGTSLLGDARPGRSVYLVAQTPLAHQYAIVRDGMKLIFDAWSRRRVLFDLQRDPGEQANVSAAHPDRTRELSRRLDTWRKLQIAYYGNLRQHRTWYPPRLKD